MISALPKEIVELSYRTGEDLVALHQSYRTLIQQRFDDFRAERMNYLNNEWRPEFKKMETPLKEAP